MMQDHQGSSTKTDWRRRPYDAHLSYKDLRMVTGLEPDRLSDWRERGVIPADMLVRVKRSYTIVEALALILISRHDDENKQTRRLLDFADALFTAINVAGKRAVAAHLLPLACVHAVLRDADAAGYYCEAANLATCEPEFKAFESYGAYRRSLQQNGFDLSVELQSAIDVIEPLDVWHLQLFCDLIGGDDDSSRGLVLLTYDFEAETFVTSFVDGSPMPLAIHDDRIDCATMIALRPAVELIETRLSKLSGIRS